METFILTEDIKMCICPLVLCQTQTLFEYEFAIWLSTSTF